MLSQLRKLLRSHGVHFVLSARDGCYEIVTVSQPENIVMRIRKTKMIFLFIQVASPCQQYLMALQSHVLREAVLITIPEENQAEIDKAKLKLKVSTCDNSRIEVTKLKERELYQSCCLPV